MRPLLRLTIALSLAAPLTASAQSVPSPAIAPERFAQCLQLFGERARAAGLTAPAVEQALSQVRFEQQVVVADRRQPEFVEPFATYLDRRLTPERISRGRQLLQEHAPLLARLQSDYGVPPEVLVSFWGLESNFGSFFGRIPVLNSLATLACEGRRGEFFTSELINALRIVERGDVPASAMVGSWAGAMGHTQFMPTSYLRYARDGDGDGRVDLWGSVPDALTSAANFLQQIGWQRGQRWGDEVVLPAGFAFELSGRKQPRPLPEWRELGIAGEVPAEGDAALVVPSGHRGPAFLVYDNFEVILRWNRSEAYALAVGLLADRLVGDGTLKVAPPRDLPRLSRAQVEQLQRTLAARGFDSGTPDGVLGPATRDALRRFQQQRGMVADGFPDTPVLQALGVL
jgi:membrane-bound lytic murein transglycosylase B